MNQGGISTGIDAYEAGFDWIAQNLWRMVSLNLILFTIWLIFEVLIVLIAIHYRSRLCFWLLTTLFNTLFAFPLWETMNIVRYISLNKNEANASLLCVRCLVTNAVFFLLCCVGYLCFFIPGVYIHTRLLLFLPVLAGDPRKNCFAALAMAWRLSEGRFLPMYSLWVATVILTPFAFLPLGLGFVLEKPVKAIAKQMMYEEVIK